MSDQVTLSKDQNPGSSITALYRAAVGPINANDYLPIFDRFEASEHAGLSWNWSACLYTVNWMIFRNMWGPALIYVTAMVVIPLVLLGVGRLIFQWSESIEISVMLICLALGFCVPGLLGNAIFYAKCRKSMTTALASTATLNEACAKLNQEAGSRKRFIRILLTNMLLACIATLAYALIPSEMPAPVPVSTDVAKAKSSVPATSDVAAAPAMPVSLPTMPVSSPSLPVSSPTMPELVTSAPAVLESAASSATTATTVTTATTAVPVASASTPAAPATQPTWLATADNNAMKSSALKPTASSRPTRQSFYINIGLFADANNAHNVRSKLQAANLPVISQEVKTRKGRYIRVRVGPFKTRTQGLAAIKKIQTLQFDAVLVKP